MQRCIAMSVEISNLKSCPTLKSSEGVLNPSYYNKPYYARKTPPSSKTVVFDWPRKARHSFGELKFPSSQTLLITQCPL